MVNTADIGAVQHRILSHQEIKAMSVVQVTESNIYRNGKPVPGGLFDIGMGTTESGEFCHTCYHNKEECKGHYGHISFAVPIYNSIYIQAVQYCLNLVCSNCSRLLVKRTVAKSCRLTGREKLSWLMKKLPSNPKCEYCGLSAQPRYKTADSEKNSTMISAVMPKNVGVLKEQGLLAQTGSYDTGLLDLHGDGEIDETVFNDPHMLELATALQKNARKLTKAELARLNAKPESDKDHDHDPDSGSESGPGDSSSDDDSDSDYDSDELDNANESVAGSDYDPELDDSADDESIASISSGPDTAIGAESLGDTDNVNEPDEPEQDTAELFGLVNARASKKSRRKKIKGEPFSARAAYTILSGITPEDCELLGLDNRYSRPESMIYINFGVIPPNNRPAVSGGTNQRKDDDLTTILTFVVSANNDLENAILEKKPKEVIDQRINILTAFTNLVNANKQKTNSFYHIHHNGTPLMGISERINRKGGRIRGNELGKRVEASARTVISPDPKVWIDELGVPIEICKILTVAEVVTPYNKHYLGKLVANGSKWPGANMIIQKNANTGRTETRKIANISNPGELDLHVGDIVERHLQYGDPVAFNRQPSLHKLSILGHKVVPIENSNTFRMNPPVVSGYNADFDGDEMNIHVPQHSESIVELEELVLLSKGGIINPANSRSIIGAIQDNIIGTAMLTHSSTRLNKSELQTLAIEIKNFDGRLPEPAGHDKVTGKPYWFGRQVISLFLPAINLVKKSTTAENLEDEIDKIDATVIIKDGVLLQGILDKNTIGPNKANSLIQLINNDCGPDHVRQFMADLQNVVNRWITIRGISLSIGEMINTPEADREIKAKVNEILQEADEKLAKIDAGLIVPAFGRTMAEQHEVESLEVLNGALGETARIALKQYSLLESGYKALIATGSKGKIAENLGKTSGAIGSQVVGGLRLKMLEGRTLSIFSRGDTSPAARGFVVSNYIDATDPGGYFSDSAAGRKGVIDTATGTQISGYIARRLSKALEDILVRYDMTVRNGTGKILQPLYGYDGFSCTALEEQKLITLKLDDAAVRELVWFDIKKDLKPVLSSGRYKSAVIKRDIGYIQSLIDNEHAQILQDRDWLRQTRFKSTNKMLDDKVSLPIDFRRILTNARSIELYGSKKWKTDLDPEYVIITVKQVIETLPGLFINPEFAEKYGIPDRFNIAINVLKRLIRMHMSSKRVIFEYKLDKATFDSVVKQILSIFIRSIADPGETVGMVAAHSFAEPGTQMTLDTFHASGVQSASKVTAGGIDLFDTYLRASAKKLKRNAITILRFNESLIDNMEYARILASEIDHIRLEEIYMDQRVLVEPAGSDPTVTHYGPDIEWLSSFFRNTVGPKPKYEATSRFVIRFELDRKKFYHHRLNMSYIRERIEQFEPNVLYVTNSNDNYDSLVLRVHIAIGNVTKKYDTQFDLAKRYASRLLENLVLRGVDNIVASDILHHNFEYIDPETGGIASKKEWHIRTYGSNLKQFHYFKHIDHSKIYSTDLREVFEVYGIGAARECLYEAFTALYGDYGVSIDEHHMSVLCDMMCHEGNFTPIYRSGFSNSSMSTPYCQISFEEMTNQLAKHSLKATLDPLTGVSGNIAIGRAFVGGTNSFELVYDNSNFGITTNALLDTVNAIVKKAKG